MPINCSDFIASATPLQSSSNEIDLRNCMSRAYYGAYHHALAFANQQNMTTNFKSGSHEDLSMRFEDSGNRSDAYKLRHMHSQRCKADYKLKEKISKIDAEMQLKTVNRFVADHPI